MHAVRWLTVPTLFFVDCPNKALKISYKYRDMSISRKVVAPAIPNFHQLMLTLQGVHTSINDVFEIGFRDWSHENLQHVFLVTAMTCAYNKMIVP